MAPAPAPKAPHFCHCSLQGGWIERDGRGKAMTFSILGCPCAHQDFFFFLNLSVKFSKHRYTHTYVWCVQALLASGGILSETQLSKVCPSLTSFAVAVWNGWKVRNRLSLCESMNSQPLFYLPVSHFSRTEKESESPKQYLTMSAF